ncbi:MAG: hypothetical protein LBI69_00255 [Puniceicoccales bacterium]|jgi:hypothetical protein|nr:hypothetical protein [Puniceicoccales bacterium]
MKINEQMEWCVVKLESDMNWWILEANWLPKVDGEELMGILDPKQVEYMFDLLEPLQEFGLQQDIVERAFFRFLIDRDLGDGRVRLLHYADGFAATDEKLFALPNAFNEGNGSYAEFLDHITIARVKMINGTGHFVQKVSVDELEETVREMVTSTQIGELPTHLFYEIIGILEYSPLGFGEDDGDDDEDRSGNWLMWKKEADDLVEEIGEETSR